MKLTAIENSRIIENNFKSYIKSTFEIQDPTFNDIFREKIEDVKLLKGPYVSLSKPYKPGKSLRKMIEEGIVSKLLLEMTGLNIDRPLYMHQEKAVIKANEGKNLIISTGTGSGKTESFLIPVLNSISKDIENGLNNRGIQALLLYPMNALANDQRERIREILKDYPEITFGHYTGETETKQKDAYNKYVSEYGEDPLDNELISREAILETPPNILFTNYSMLEYMLLRPFEATLITKHTSKNWKYIVLDEAHTYKGALGIEISYLMKRLLGNLSNRPQFILTSATLANDKKDYPGVIDFASKLTSSTFTDESIIIGESVDLRTNGIKFLDPKIYTQLESNSDKVHEVLSQLGLKPLEDEDLNLKSILMADKNYEKFVKFLNTPKDVTNLVSKMGPEWNEENLSAFIQLISRISQSNSLSYEDKLEIVDCKYHNFIRSLDGCFVTFKPKKKLQLTKTKLIEGQKALQLGLCKYCQGSYIMGYIHGDKFYQADDEDLYENNEALDTKEMSIFVTKDDYEKLDDDDKNYDKLEEYELCNTCGHIHLTANLYANGCDCKYTDKILVLRQNIEDTKLKTNLYKCTLCSSINSNGIVDSFYVGKDTSTSIISQILYKNLDGEYSLKEDVVSNLFGKPIPTRNNVSDENVKQMIVFSDSRQQASFFATYFEDKHFQFLRKRLILDYLEENPISSIDDAVTSIAYKIEKSKLFDKGTVSKTEAWKTVLTEMLEFDGNFSLSGYGMAAFVPNLEIIDKIDEAQIKEHLPQLSKEDFKTIVWFILDSMRSIPAIDYNYAAKLSFEDRSSVLEHRATDKGGLVLEPVIKDNSFVKSLIPFNRGRNLYTNFLTKGLGLSYDEVIEILKVVFQVLVNGEIIYQNPNSPTRYVYNYRDLKLVSTKNVKWYQCKKCKKISCINLNDICTKSNCDGKIQEINPDEISLNSYYYNEYKNKEIAKIRVEEHTAQLTKEQGRKFQNDFKQKKINILSCSTTFEMGVDIGSLSTVFMRNVPPSPANYVQRAGRAGRKKETPAYVLTFCSTGSHDFTYYTDPIKMIEGKITPPYFELDNKKIYERHILAVALSLYFKKNPELFNKVGTFLNLRGNEGFIDYLKTSPNEFIEFVTKNINKNFSKEYSLWLDGIINEDSSKWNLMCKSIISDLEELENARNIANTKGESNKRYVDEIKNINDDKLLNNLARFNVIPKYGFPIDTVDLKVPSDKNLELSRDLTLALSEYAPDSEILVNKRKYKSRYIVKNMVNSFDIRYFKKCDNCRSINVELTDDDTKLVNCKNCGFELLGRPKSFIKPLRGFVSEQNALANKRLKPKRSYASEVFYLGSGDKGSEPEMISDCIEISSFINDSLVVINENPFFVCTKCGYSKIIKNQAFFPSYQENHINVYGSKCSNNLLLNYNLGHDFKTDVVIIKLMNNMLEHETALSVLYALIEGISIGLNIERQDLAGLLHYGIDNIQFVMYDNVPGGAGHVKQLLDKRNLFKVLRSSLRIVSQDCCNEDTSCYYCLQNYTNQKHHSVLKRSSAISGLKLILESIGEGQELNDIDFSKCVKNEEDWISLSYLYNISEIREFDKHYPKPDYVYEPFNLNGLLVEPMFTWKEEKIMYFEESINQDAQRILKNNGYKIISKLEEMGSLNIWR